MEKKEAYLKARKRVEARLGFYIHLAVYIGVSILLVVINMTTSPKTLWSVWPAIGWGIAVIFHGIAVFGFSGKTSGMKERMIQKEMQKGQ